MEYDDDNGELRKLNAEVLDDSDAYEKWEKLVRAAESLEGGIGRNSSPQAISALRDIYNRFLMKFPLFFGYWKKYADLEFAIAGTEAAELVYERGIASIPNSVDLWTNYCAFKLETCHEPDIIRELFERGAEYVGLDFLAHPFWDKYIEFEERVEAWERIFQILGRVITIPMHQYARYFERFRQQAASRPLQDLVSAELLAQFKAEISMESSALPNPKSEQELDQELRSRIENYHMELFHKNQQETNRRWEYECRIRRPYFHVTELEEQQRTNWHEYLDFEQGEGDYHRITFLYERCLVVAAYYDEFWLRYARWMLGQLNSTEDVRNIYQRASCIYAPISRPAIRLQWALFEEMNERYAVAEDIYDAILVELPGQLEAIIGWTNLKRRTMGNDAAVSCFQAQYEATHDPIAKAGIAAEWATFLWKIKEAPDEARTLLKAGQSIFADNKAFWTAFLTFEAEQPTSNDSYGRVKAVFDDVRRTRLPVEAVKELALIYTNFLVQRCTKDVAKECLNLDRELNLL